ncbi:hypothetical protein Tco_1207793 [Tanacetum coccineum]
MPLGTESRTTNILETKTVTGSTLSNTPLSSNSFAARRNYHVHRELLKHLVIKKDKDIVIDAIPLATKLPVIVDYKLHKEGMLVDKSRWKLQEILFNDKDVTRNRQRRLERRNLKIQKMNIKFRGGLLGLKRLHGFLEVTAAQVHNGNYAKCAAGGKITIV